MNENDEKARIEKRKLETVEKIALLSFAVSHASPKPLTPPEAYQRARAFIEHALSVNPDADFRV